MSKTTAMVKLAALISVQEVRGAGQKARQKKPCSDKSVMKLAAALGAYTADSAADVVADDQIIQALARNRGKHPFHYWLNPFVGGPLSELGHRIDRRVNASRATSPTFRVLSGGFPLNPLSLVGAPIAAVAGGPARREKARGIYQDRIAPYEFEPESDKRESDLYEQLAIQDDAKGKKEKGEKEKKAGIFKADGPYAVDQAAQVLAMDKLLAANRYNEQRHKAQWMLNPLVGGPLSALGQRMLQRNAAMKATSPTAAVLSNIPLGATFSAETGVDLADGLEPGIYVDDIADLAATALGDAKRRNKARQIAYGAGVGRESGGDDKGAGGDKKKKDNGGDKK